MQSYTIHLIRHGVTEGNLLGQYIGSTDLPLAREGIDRLRKLAERGGYPTAQAYYCSPLLRCRETLSLLYPGVEPTVIDGFRECDFGQWEGKTAKQLAEEDPHFLEWMESGSQATTIAVDDYRHLFPIPQSEYRYNENITAEHQNPGWSYEVAE